ncbi:MAG: FG-GAP-like repeat-containing protein [Acidobacteriota bacterium]
MGFAYLLLICGLAAPSLADEQPWSRIDIAGPVSPFDNASSVETADFDGDGDLDVLAAGEAEGAGLGEVAWWENTAGDGTAWTKNIINGTVVRQTRKASAADFDGDGDMDVVVITEWFQDIIVYLNSDGVGTSWTQVTVDDNVPFTCVAEVADVDGDGDIDIVGGGKRASHVLAWWENDGSAGNPWIEHTIRANFTGPCAVAMADVDKDGLLDVFAGAEFLDLVSWFKNPGTGGGSWAETQISTSQIDGVRAVDAGDFDGDGDIDAVAAARAISDVFWFENTSGDGSTWTEHLVDDDSNEAWDVHAADLDEDGDLDLLVAARTETPPNPQGAVVMWDNENGDGSVWTRYDVDGALSTPQGVFTGDIDGDGRVDVLTATGGDRVSWFENTSTQRNAAFPDVRPVDEDFTGARAVTIGDIDCDADLDVVAAGSGDTIEWWSNDDTDGTQWTQQTQIGSGFFGVRAVAIGDLDHDGDKDVVGVADTDNDVAFFENTAGDGSAWTESTIDATFDGARAVALGDIDGDGNLDVAAAAFDANDFTWWSNLNGDASAFAETSISAALSAVHDGASAIGLADIDGDGDLDVIAGTANDNDLLFFENTAGDGGTWSSVTIDGNFDGPSSVWIADIDEDGDMDVVAAAQDGNDIAWFENTAGDGSAWSAAQFISENLISGPTAVGAADFDGDGDLDVAATEGLSSGRVVWYENTVGDGSAWGAAQDLLLTFGGAAGLALGDVDRNGLVDVIAVAETDDDVTFLPNLGGQFALETLVTAPASLGNNITDDLLRITATHLGIAGDADLELATFELLFEETSGDPLTTNEAMAVIENVFVYLDDDEDGTWALPGDTLVATVSRPSLDLDAGIQSVPFTDGDVNVQIQQGTPRTYFAVVQTTSNFTSRGLNSLQVTHVTEASSTAENRDTDTPVRLAWTPNTVSGPFDVNSLATPSADLLIESITDSTDPVNPGGTITYTVTVRNDGDWKAENVRVTNSLPGDATFVSTSGCAEDPAGSGTCTLGDLPLLETASFDLTVTANLDASGTLTYQATVSSDTVEAAMGNETASETTEVQGEADLAITVGGGPATYVAGEEFAFFIQVQNLGPADEANAMVVDNFPAELLGVTWTCEGLGGATCGNPSGSGNISETATMPPGSFVTYQATGTVQGGFAGTLSNTATVTGSNDSNVANDSATLGVLGTTGAIFRDGLESGDFSAWDALVQQDP